MFTCNSSSLFFSWACFVANDWSLAKRVCFSFTISWGQRYSSGPHEVVEIKVATTHLLPRLLTSYFFRVDSSCPFVWSWAWTSPFFSLVTVSKASFKRSTASWTDWSTSRTLSRLHQTRYSHYLPSSYYGEATWFQLVKDKFRISNWFIARSWILNMDAMDG